MLDLWYKRVTIQRTDVIPNVARHATHYFLLKIDNGSHMKHEGTQWYQRQLYGGGSACQHVSSAQRDLLERNGIRFLSLKETKSKKVKSNKAHGDHN